MDIAIRKARPSDAPALAELIMEAMSPECCAFFYGADHTAADFRHFLTTLASRPNTQYSYENALVAVDNDNVAGAAVSYDGAQLHALRAPFIEGMSNLFLRDFQHFGDETQAGELYLDSLAVFPPYRHRGIASQLLRATAAKGNSLLLPAVGLLVDEGNPNALCLYLSVGFKFKDFSSWGGHKMRHLQMDCKE